MRHFGNNFPWAYLEVGILGDVPRCLQIDSPKKQTFGRSWQQVALKTLDAIGNCQRPVLHGVSQPLSTHA